MIAMELQRDLIEELKELEREMCFKAPGGDFVKMNFFAQNLPVRSLDTETASKRTGETEDFELDEDAAEDGLQDEELENQFPYCIVKIDSGKSQNAEEAHIIGTKLIIGIFDDSRDVSGYRNILNVFEDIRRRFRTNPILKNRYVVQDEISWALPDEDKVTFPYYYGVMYLNWITAEYRREDVFI